MTSDRGEFKLVVLLRQSADGSMREYCLVCSNRRFRSEVAALAYAKEHRH